MGQLPLFVPSLSIRYPLVTEQVAGLRRCGMKYLAGSHRPFARRYRLLMKQFTVGVSLCAFLLQTVVPAYAQQASFSPTKISLLKSIEIPESIGYVTDVFVPDQASDKTLFILQDPHNNIKAQYSTAKIYDTLVRRYPQFFPKGYPTVAMEGTADVVLDYSVLTEFPFSDIRLVVSDFLVNEGRLDGTEYYKINYNDKTQIKGVEEPALYFDNLMAYNRAERLKAGSNFDLSDFRKALEELKRRAYSYFLKQLDKTIKQFDANPERIKEHFMSLEQLAKVKSISLMDFSSYQVMRRLIDQENKIIKQQLSSELASLGVFQAPFNFASRKETQNTLDQLLLSISRVPFKSQDFSETVKYRQYLEDMVDIRAEEFFEDLEKIYTLLTKALAKSKREQLIADRDRKLDLVEKLWKFEVTDVEYAYVAQIREELFSTDFWQALNPVFDEYLLPYRINEQFYEVTMVLREAEQFYEAALARNEALLENTLTLMQDDGLNASFMVVGGFHAEGITHLLRKKKISYVLMLPQVGLSQDQSLYWQTLSGNRSLFERAIRSYTAKAKSSWGVEDLTTAKEALMIALSAARDRIADNPEALDSYRNQLAHTELTSLLNTAQISDSGVTFNFQSETGQTLPVTIKVDIVDESQAKQKQKEAKAEGVQVKAYPLSTNNSRVVQVEVALPLKQDEVASVTATDIENLVPKIQALGVISEQAVVSDITTIGFTVTEGNQIVEVRTLLPGASQQETANFKQLFQKEQSRIIGQGEFNVTEQVGTVSYVKVLIQGEESLEESSVFSDREQRAFANQAVMAVVTAKALGDYKLVGRLGEGTMAVVDLYKNSETGEQVAIKYPKKLDAESISNIRDELKKLIHLRGVEGVPELIEGGLGENLVTTVEGQEVRMPFIITRYEPGKTLYDLFRGKEGTKFPSYEDFSIIDRLEIVKNLINVVHGIHDKGVIHNDLKFPNVLLTEEGKIVVLDFGSATFDSIINPLVLNRAAAQRMKIGSLQSRSPELAQIAEGREIKILDRRSDIFSLGTVIYLILTNRFPVDFGPDFSQANQRIADFEGNFLSIKETLQAEGINNEIIEQIERALRDALTPNVEKRTGTALELANALDEVISKITLESMGVDLAADRIPLSEEGGTVTGQSLGMYQKNIFDPSLANWALQQKKDGISTYEVIFKAGPLTGKQVYLSRPSNYEHLNLGQREQIFQTFRRQLDATEQAVYRGLTPPILEKGFYLTQTGVQVPFIISETIPNGTNLKNIIKRLNRRSPLRAVDNYAETPLIERMRLMKELLYSFKELQSSGTIHRDINPSKLVVTAEGKLQIMDFQNTANINDVSRIQDGFKGGSYGAPEMKRGPPQSVGYQVDVYALGSIFYEMLTGYSVAVTLNSGQLLPSISDVLRSQEVFIPGQLEGIIAKAINPDPKKRYGSVFDMFIEFSEALKSEEAVISVISEPPPIQGRGSMPSVVEKMIRSLKTKLGEDRRNVKEVTYLTEGGMGEIYKVTLFDGTHYAIKIPIDLSEEKIKAINSDIRILDKTARVKEVSQLIDAGTVPVKHPDGRIVPVPFLVMEFIDGETLEEKMRIDEPSTGLDRLKNYSELNLSERLSLIIKQAEYLHKLHETGILHRDVKPENLIYNSRNLARGIDLGLAAVMTKEERKKEKKRHDGFIVGTPIYMSPEQINGEYLTMDGRVDVYGLGAVLHEVLTGRIFNKGATIKKSLEFSFNRDHRTPVSQDLSPELNFQSQPGYIKAALQDVEKVVLKATDPNPKNRYRTAGELADALTEILIDIKDIEASIVGVGNQPQVVQARSLGTLTLPGGKQVQLVAKLGEGGQGVVYDAKIPYGNQGEFIDVVVKIPKLFSKRSREHLVLGQERRVYDDGIQQYFFRKNNIDNFRRERALWSIAQHTISVPQLIDEGGLAQINIDGRNYPTPYIVLEKIEGQTINEEFFIRHPSGRKSLVPYSDLSLIDRLERLKNIALAVHELHLQGLIHNDLKPQNVMVLPNGEIRILDLGVALQAKEYKSKEFMNKNLGQNFGTLLYRAPEIAKLGLGELSEIGPQSDVFSLGVLSYFLLAGSRYTQLDPSDLQEATRQIAEFDGEINSPQTFFSRQKKTAEFMDAIPQALDQVLRKALDPNLANRYRSAKELADAIKEVILELEENAEDLAEGSLEKKQLVSARSLGIGDIDKSTLPGFFESKEMLLVDYIYQKRNYPEQFPEEHLESVFKDLLREDSDRLRAFIENNFLEEFKDKTIEEFFAEHRDLVLSLFQQEYFDEGFSPLYERRILDPYIQTPLSVTKIMYKSEQLYGKEVVILRRANTDVEGSDSVLKNIVERLNKQGSIIVEQGIDNLGPYVITKEYSDHEKVKSPRFANALVAHLEQEFGSKAASVQRVVFSYEFLLTIALENGQRFAVRSPARADDIDEEKIEGFNSRYVELLKEQKGLNDVAQYMDDGTLTHKVESGELKEIPFTLMEYNETVPNYMVLSSSDLKQRAYNNKKNPEKMQIIQEQIKEIRGQAIRGLEHVATTRMSSVFKATLEDGSLVVVKLTNDMSNKGKEKFNKGDINLTKALKGIEGMNQYVDDGELRFTQGSSEIKIPYLVVDYVEGSDLEKLIKSGNLTFRERLQIALQMAQLLERHHVSGQVFRDFKPENIVASVTEGAAIEEKFKLTLIDFGLAAENIEVAKQAVGGGTLFGSPYFLSPEVIRTNSEKVDQRVDVYSLGASIYQLVTGKAPVPGENAAMVLSKIVQGRLSPSVSDSILRLKENGEINIDENAERVVFLQALDAIVDRSVAGEVEERYQNPGDVAKDIQQLIGFLKGEVSEDDLFALITNNQLQTPLRREAISAQSLGQDEIETFPTFFQDREILEARQIGDRTIMPKEFPAEDLEALFNRFLELAEERLADAFSFEYDEQYVGKTPAKFYAAYPDLVLELFKKSYFDQFHREGYKLGFFPRGMFKQYATSHPIIAISAQLKSNYFSEGETVLIRRANKDVEGNIIALNEVIADLQKKGTVILDQGEDGLGLYVITALYSESEYGRVSNHQFVEELLHYLETHFQSKIIAREQHSHDITVIALENGQRYAVKVPTYITSPVAMGDFRNEEVFPLRQQKGVNGLAQHVMDGALTQNVEGEDLEVPFIVMKYESTQAPGNYEVQGIESLREIVFDRLSNEEKTQIIKEGLGEINGQIINSVEFLESTNMSIVFKAHFVEGVSAIIKIPRLLNEDLIPFFETRDIENTKALRGIEGVNQYLAHGEITATINGIEIIIPYLAIEFVEGVDLEKLINQGNLSFEEKLQISIQMAQVLTNYHASGQVSRDFKPGNIVVAINKDKPLEERFSLTMIDFGLAAPTVEEAKEYIRAKKRVGTPLFIAPEVYVYNAEKVDQRGDVFSLGGSIYNLITGLFPIAAKSLKEIKEKLAQGKLNIKASTIVAKLVYDGELSGREKFTQEIFLLTLDAVLDKAQARDVDERYVNAQLLKSDLQILQGYLNGSVSDQELRELTWATELKRPSNREFFSAQSLGTEIDKVGAYQLNLNRNPALGEYQIVSQEDQGVTQFLNEVLNQLDINSGEENPLDRIIDLSLPERLEVIQRLIDNANRLGEGVTATRALGLVSHQVITGLPASPLSNEIAPIAVSLAVFAPESLALLVHNAATGVYPTIESLSKDYNALLISLGESIPGIKETITFVEQTATTDVTAQIIDGPKATPEALAKAQFMLDSIAQADNAGAVFMPLNEGFLKQFLASETGRAFGAKRSGLFFVVDSKKEVRRLKEDYPNSYRRKALGFVDSHLVSELGLGALGSLGKFGINNLLKRVSSYIRMMGLNQINPENVALLSTQFEDETVESKRLKLGDTAQFGANTDYVAAHAIAALYLAVTPNKELDPSIFQKDADGNFTLSSNVLAALIQTVRSKQLVARMA